MGKLFGTDGIRGVANKFPLDGITVYRVAQLAAKRLLSNYKKRNRPFFIGKDTRISGGILEHAVAAGVASTGADVRLLGVVPTPAVAYLVKELQGLGGIMISASHNPFQDNGIKIFGSDGYKLNDAIEEAIEDDLFSNTRHETPIGEKVGTISSDENSAQFWLSHVQRAYGDIQPSKKLKIAIDCANGSLSRWAPKFFADLGFSVDAIGVNPNGTNINKNVGSTSLEAILNVMSKEHFHIGFAFDGDADRVIAISSEGDIIDGDYILAITAKYLKDKEKLPGNTMVTTVMANLGLDIAMKNNNIKVFKTQVGDRYVLEEMQKTQSILGGEQSGHIILSEHATTGDGLLTACMLLRIMHETGASLRELSGVMSKLPQLLVNIKVKDKNYKNCPEILEVIRNTEEKLEGKGRLLVRPSGTEDLLRVMAEGPDETEIKVLVNGIAKTISKYLC